MLLGLRSLVRRRSWREGGYYATPSIAHDRAYLGVIDGVFSAFDVHTGAHRWSRKLAGSIYGSAAVWNETVYVGTTERDLLRALGPRRARALEAATRRQGPRLADSYRRACLHLDDEPRDRSSSTLERALLDWRFADGYYSPLVVAGPRAFLVGKGRIYALENAPRVRPPLVPNAS